MPITASVSCNISAGGDSAAGAINFSMDPAAGFLGNQQIVGTSSEQILLGDVSTPKAIFVANLDDTNFVQIDSASTFDKFPQKLLPGQGVLLLPQTGTLYVKADVAPVKIWVVAG